MSKPVKVTVTRTTGVEEAISFDMQVDPSKDIYDQLSPLFAAADKRTAIRNRRILDFQEFVKTLDKEARMAAYLALDVLHGSISAEDAAKKKEESDD